MDILKEILKVKVCYLMSAKQIIENQSLMESEVMADLRDDVTFAYNHELLNIEADKHFKEIERLVDESEQEVFQLEKDITFIKALSNAPALIKKELY